MHNLAKLLFVIGAIPTVGGIAVLVALAHQPTKWRESRGRAIHDHLQGLARYLIAGGMALLAAKAIMGWAPPWPAVAVSLGLGLGMGMHAREKNLIALAQERFDDASQESGA
jgi:hypothetical protein